MTQIACMIGSVPTRLSPEAKAFGWIIGSVLLTLIGMALAKYNSWLTNNKDHRRKDVIRIVAWSSLIIVPLLIIVIATCLILSVENEVGEIEMPVQENTDQLAQTSHTQDDWSITTVALPNGGKKILKINKATGETFTLLAGKWSKVETETLETVQMRRVLLAIRKAETSIEDIAKHDFSLEKLSDEELEAIAAGTTTAGTIAASSVKRLFQQSDHNLWTMIKKNSDQNLSFKAIEKMTDEKLYSIVLDALVYEIEKR